MATGNFAVTNQPIYIVLRSQLLLLLLRGLPPGHIARLRLESWVRTLETTRRLPCPTHFPPPAPLPCPAHFPALPASLPRPLPCPAGFPAPPTSLPPPYFPAPAPLPCSRPTSLPHPTSLLPPHSISDAHA